SATSANTRLSVSSVLQELTCSLRTARITVADNKKRFSILSPAEYTSFDRMCAPILGSCAFVRLLESRARSGVVRRTGLDADRVPRRRHKDEEAGETICCKSS